MAALRASYHRILDRIEHMLPAKLRPLYNHPAGKARSTGACAGVCARVLVSMCAIDNVSCMKVITLTWHRLHLQLSVCRTLFMMFMCKGDAIDMHDLHTIDLCT